MCLPGIWLRDCIYFLFFMGSWKGLTSGKDAKALAWRCTWSHMYACWHMYNWCVLNWQTVDIWIHFTQMLAKWRLHHDTPTWSTLWVHAWILGSILHLQTTHLYYCEPILAMSKPLWWMLWLCNQASQWMLFSQQTTLLGSFIWQVLPSMWPPIPQ